MRLPSPFRLAVIVVAIAALTVPLAAGGSLSTTSFSGTLSRTLYATDASGRLLTFSAAFPQFVRSKQITGLPQGVALQGIDFRPMTGDLYALGSDRVVYRVNPQTAIAIAEGPSDANVVLGSTNIGFDFNPTVDKIRVTNDAEDNLRLNPDEGNQLAKDTSLTPAGVDVVGSAYINSSFSAVRPTATELYALDIASSPDTLWIQRPANAGTLIMPKSLGFDLGASAGFDIAGKNNVGFVAGTATGRAGADLYSVDLASGQTSRLGRIGNGRVAITGLAAWQDQ